MIERQRARHLSEKRPSLARDEVVNFERKTLKTVKRIIYTDIYAAFLSIRRGEPESQGRQI